MPSLTYDTTLEWIEEDFEWLGEIYIGTMVILKAIGILAGWDDSDIVSPDYFIKMSVFKVSFYLAPVDSGEPFRKKIKEV